MIEVTPEALIGYLKLVNKVKKVDKEAAKYLREEAPKLKDFGLGKNLSWCFIWEDTPQGHKYWQRVEEALLKREEE